MVADAAGQVTREAAYTAANALLFEEINGYDLRGNLTSTQTESEIRQYIVDDRDWTLGMQVYELDGATLKYAIAYTYDNVGNMLSQALTTSSFASTLPFVDVLDTVFDVALSQTQTIAYSYDAANRLVSETGAYEGGGGYSVAYSYDAAGNMTGKTVDTGSGPQAYSYFWSGENRILAVDAPGTANDWVGNSIMAGEGKEQHTWPVRRRTGATDNNLNILYDPDSNHVLRERAGTGNGAYRKDYVLDVVRDRVLGVVGSGSMSGGVAANTTYWYQNFRGDLRAMSDGAATDTRGYLPTGVAVAGSADAVDFPDVRYGFQGKEVQTTGLADFENRFYAAHQGRFGSRDPLRQHNSGYYLEGGETNYQKDQPDGSVYGDQLSDFGIGRGQQILGLDLTGLDFEIRVNGPHSCDSTIRWYIRKAGYIIKPVLDMAHSKGGCISQGKGDLRNDMLKAWERSDIKCESRKWILGNSKTGSGCGRQDSVNNIFVAKDMLTQSSCDWYEGYGAGRFVRVLFHEMMHVADPEGRGTGDDDHGVIRKCLEDCKSLLKIPKFSWRADSISAARRCRDYPNE